MFQKKTGRKWEVAPPTNDDVMNLLANDGLLLSGGSADSPQPPYWKHRVQKFSATFATKYPPLS